MNKISFEAHTAIKEAILAVIYRKQDINSFFQTHVGRNFRTNYKELTRAGIVDVYFNYIKTLNTSTGDVILSGMLKNLSEWTDFNSYFFNNGSLNKSHATSCVARVKKFLPNIQKTAIQDEKVKQKTAALNGLKEEYLSFFNHKDVKQRGYLLELFLNKLATHFELETSESFKLVGEQIDGSIKYDGDHYIFEAKWQEKYISSDSLYTFAQKIEGKFYGRGFFFSINGYTDQSLLAVSHAKKMLMVLIDGQDLYSVLEERITFKEMIERKIKAAQTKGLFYYDPVLQNSKFTVTVSSTIKEVEA